MEIYQNNNHTHSQCNNDNTDKTVTIERQAVHHHTDKLLENSDISDN